MNAPLIDPRIIKARSALIMSQPFWGTLALHLQAQEDRSRETMATDGTHLFYNPAFLDTLSEAELEGVLAHEVSHCAYRHHTRRGPRDPKLWNEAADYAINRDLIAAGFTLPKDALFEPKYVGLSTEEIFATLEREDEKKKQQQSQGGQGGKPGAQGQRKADPGGCGEVIDAAPGHAPAEIAQADAEWETRVRQAIGVAKRQHAGTVPSHLERLVQEINKPRVDWRDVLRRFIDERTRSDYSWMNPNKRFLSQGLVLPGIVADGINHIGVIVDTSGSIDEKALTRFAGELQAAIDEGAASRVTVIYCDADVHRSETFDQGDAVKLNATGGGGTRFSPAFDWFEQNAPDTSALIYFTDLECDDFGIEPVSPVLWAAYGSARRIRENDVPFGEIVQLID